MKWGRQLYSIQFLEHLQSMLQMGFTLKESLSSTSDLYPEYATLVSLLLSDIRSGKSVSHSIQSRLTLMADTGVYLSLPALDLEQWIEDLLSFFQERQKIMFQLYRQMLYPVFVCVASLCVTAFLYLGYLPQMSGLLGQFDQQLPSYFYLIQIGLMTVKECFPFIILFLILFMLCFGDRLKQCYCWLLSPLMKRRAMSDVFFQLAMPLKNGVDLKTVVAAIEILPSSVIYKKIKKFQKKCLASSQYSLVFNELLSDSAYLLLIRQSIVSNRLDKCLYYLGCCYRDRYLQLIRRCSVVASSAVLVFSAINVSFGFYLAILPMQSLIEEIL